MGQFTYRAILISIVVFCASFQNASSQRQRRRNRFKPIKRVLQDRLQERIIQFRERNTERICYDDVGCFNLPHIQSPLQKTPETPKLIDTKFYLFNKNINFSHPEILHYNDGGESLTKSNFNYSQPLKMIVHGYMSKWNEKGALILTNLYLKMYDCNIILVDWQKGARGPQYAVAAANTELVGRQLGILLLEMVEKGLNPKDIHLIGFSLGAHVSGSASEILKLRNKLIGRITGLDAASPLFRSNHFREKYKKLDKEDAVFVDVLHTDASPSVTDGFGLWEAIGHVDYFANGGQEQPGCNDIQDSIVVSTFERGLTREIACSHIRAFHLFIESIMNKFHNGCQFTSYSCPGGLPAFESGYCFPEINNSSMDLDPIYRTEIGRFGEDAKGEGVMFFTTRDNSPYCGTQLQATVKISQKSVGIKGVLILKLRYLNNTVNFQFKTSNSKLGLIGKSHAHAVAKFNSLQKVKEISADLIYFELDGDEGSKKLPVNLVYIDSIQVSDMFGNKWQRCGKEESVLDNTGNNVLPVMLKTKKLCK